MNDRDIRFGLYFNLLTDRQKDVIRLHEFEDFSFTEVSEKLGISRQAVNEALKAAIKKIDSYENKIGLYKDYINRINFVKEIKSEFKNVLDEKELERLAFLLDKFIYINEVDS